MVPASFTPVQSPAAGLPLTFLLKSRTSIMPSFIVQKTTTDGKSFTLELFPKVTNDDAGTWSSLYVEVSGGGGTCETNEFTVIVPDCSFGTIVQTPSGTVNVGQMSTVPITISTSQAPSLACAGAVFIVDPQTDPGFVTWDTSTNKLTVSPTMEVAVGQYTVSVVYGIVGYQPFETANVMFSVSTF